MIFVHDKGRMCNNILQYAHLYAWGREHGRATMSMRFAYKYPYFHICKTPHHHFLNYVFAKYAAKLGLIPTVCFDEGITDKEIRENEHIMLTRRLVMAEGWYVRYYDLFLKYKNDILQLFDFLPEVKASVESFLRTRERESERVRERESEKGLQPSPLRLGVHIRRGDYRTFNGGKFFYTDEQYVKVINDFLALPLFRSSAPSLPRSLAIYICGNDPTLDKDYYRKQLSTVRSARSNASLAKNCPLGTKQPFAGEELPIEVSFPDGNPGEDLCLLSQCDYLIGPPSTFTLAASMYRDVPLCWLTDINKPLTPDSFKHFDYLFRHII